MVDLIRSNYFYFYLYSTFTFTSMFVCSNLSVFELLLNLIILAFSSFIVNHIIFLSDSISLSISSLFFSSYEHNVVDICYYLFFVYLCWLLTKYSKAILIYFWLYILLSSLYVYCNSSVYTVCVFILNTELPIVIFISLFNLFCTPIFLNAIISIAFLIWKPA